MQPATAIALTVASVLFCGTATAQTHVSGPVSGTWTLSGSPFIVQAPGVTVTAPDTLSIEAGVVVRFEPGASVAATGDVSVNGMPGSEVLFQAATQPGSPGDWHGIELRGGSHVFAGFEIMNSATGIANGLLGPSDLIVSDGRFSSTWTGITHENAGDLSVSGSEFTGTNIGVALAGSLGPNVTVQNNSFDGCIEAMTMAAGSSPLLGGNSATNCAVNGTRIYSAGPIDGPATWRADGMPLVLHDDSVDVTAAGSLTIEAGTVVKILNDASPAGLNVDGTLVVNGTPSSPVIFTSLRDDSVMGDTNADGAGSVPARGDWDGITISGGEASVSNVDFAYAGTAISNGISSPSDLTVTDCSFTDLWTGITHENAGDLSVSGSQFTGTNIGVALAGSLGPNVTVQNNSFDGCIEAMIMAAGSSPLLGGNSATNCAVNGTRIYSAGPIDGPATWRADGMPLVLHDDSVDVTAAGSLTIEAGTVVKILNDASPAGLNVDGTLVVNGTPSSPVIFTSLRDDSVMGDTNADGAGSVPARGDWDGITISGGEASVSNVDFAYAGTAISNGISSPSDLTVTDCSFTDLWTGITHENAGDLSVSGSQFIGTNIGVALAGSLGPNVTVQNNSFDGCIEAMTMAAGSSPLLGGNSATNCAVNGTRIYSAGPIDGPATWRADGMPLVLHDDSVNVTAAGSLTIEAGTVVKILNDASPAGLNVDGTLVLNGTPSSPVIFTSLRDDSVMGDTNADGAGNVPARGDWDGITISGGEASVSNVDFAYAGTAISNGISSPSDLTVTDCSFTDLWTGLTHEDSGALSVSGSEFNGTNIGVALAGSLGPNVTVQNNSFDGCIEAMTMAAGSSPLLGGNSASNCAVNGTRIYSAGPIDGPATWRADGMPLVLHNDSVDVTAAGSLTIEAGTVVKILNDASPAGLNVDGTLVVNGTRSRPVIFTSLRDDSVMGDTNADGAGSVPARGDWDGIAVTGSSAQIDWLDLQFAAAGLDCAIAGSLQVRDSIFARCFSGMRVSGTTSGYAGGTLFVENHEGLFLGAATTFHLGESASPDPAQRGNNDIYCSAVVDLAFDGPGLLPAQNNWWGEAPPNMAEIQTTGGGAVDLAGYRTGPARDTVSLSGIRRIDFGVDLGWEDLATCIRYRVQRDADPLFASPDIDELLPAGSRSFDDPANPPDPLLFYRVLAEE